MENIQPLIIASLELLVLGMGSVFIILTCLIFLITWTSKLLAGFEDTEHEAPRAGSSSNTPSSDNGELIAVISAAISSFKKRR